MSVLPVLRDDNGLALNCLGSEVFTIRYSGIDSSGIDAAIPMDSKCSIIHIEGTSVAARISGTASGSQEIFWTSDGVTLPPVHAVRHAHSPHLNIAAVSGTINASIIGWR
jgi:hypothetical protein